MQTNKEQILQWVAQLDNEEMLENLKFIMDSGNSTDPENELISAGLKRAASDIDNGRVRPHSDVASEHGL